MTMSSERKHFLFLVALWAALLPLYGVWLWRDQVVSPWDMAGHARSALELWTALGKGHWTRFYQLSQYYPPLFYLLAAPFSALSTHPDVYCAANWLALLVAMWATWRIGRELAGAAAGLAAGVLLPAFIYVSWMCRQPMLDLTLTATVAGTLWLLLRDRRLTERGQAHALGAAVALGLLAKWPYVFFMGLPILVYGVWEWLIARREGRLRDWARGVGWGCCWPLLAAGPWYWRAAPYILKKSTRHLNGEIAAQRGEPTIFTFENLAFYARSLWHDYLTWPLLALLGVGAAALVWQVWKGGRTLNRGKCDTNANTDYDYDYELRAQARINTVRRGWVLLGLMLLSGYGIMTMIANKDPRFVMPLVPALAVLMTHWIGRLGRRAAWGVVAAAAVLCWGLVYWNLFLHWKPDRREPGIEPLAQWVLAHRPRGRDAKVMVVPDEWTLNAAALEYALYRRDRRSEAFTQFEPLTDRVLGRCQFIVVTDLAGENSGGAPYQIANTRAVQRLAGWQVQTTIQRGDGRKILVYGRAPGAEKR